MTIQGGCWIVSKARKLRTSLSVSRQTHPHSVATETKQRRRRRKRSRRLGGPRLPDSTEEAEVHHHANVSPLTEVFKVEVVTSRFTVKKQKMMLL